MAFGNRFMRFIYAYSPAFVRDLMTSVYSSQRGRVKFGPKFYEYMADLERSQWYSNEDLEILQAEKLRRLIDYCAKQVPYYREIWSEAGIDPESIRGVEDLARLPVLDKSTVQARLEDFRSEQYRDSRQVEHFQSSGTTGRALDVYVTKDCLQLEKAFTWLHRSWGGIRLNDRAAGFVGFPVIPVSQRRPPFWVCDRSENRMIYSLQHMSRENLPFYIESLKGFKPALVYGYPTAIFLVAQYVNETGEQGLRPRSVFTASETLLPHQRAEIERAFGCQVFDWYGAVELIANIVQCERGNYHARAEYGVVEILRPDGRPVAPGEEGELVCTGLNNLAMPFIRYRVGDRAVYRGGTCACGRGGMLIASLTGRIEDVIVTPDGRWLSRLDFVFKGLANVEEAQLVQEARDRLRVRLVKRPGYSLQDETRIRANLRERVGEEMEISLEYLERIPRTRNGKFRYVISKIPLDLPFQQQTGEVLGLAAEEAITL